MSLLRSQWFVAEPALGVIPWGADSLSADLSACWMFNERGGTTVRDATGHPNTGTLTGATWVQSDQGNALSFGGDGDRVTFTTDNEAAWDGYAGGCKTFAAWVRIDGAAGVSARISGHCILCKGTGSPAGFQWGLNGTYTQLRPAVRINNANYLLTTYLQPDVWTYVATVLDQPNNEVRHYAYGKVGTDTDRTWTYETVACSSWGSDNDAAINIGTGTTSGSQDRLNGLIANVWAWSRCLTHSELRHHAANTWAPCEWLGWGRYWPDAVAAAAVTTPPGPTVFIDATAATRFVDATAHTTFTDVTAKTRFVQN